MSEYSGCSKVTFAVRVESITDQQTLELPDGTKTAAPISPGVLAVATANDVLFTPGSSAGHSGLKELAEDGNPCPLVNRLSQQYGVKHAEFIVPNLHYRVSGEPGDNLHFAVMFVQSNDLFYAFNREGLPLFDRDKQPVSGDVSKYVYLWDAGTEVNQPPGVGSNQAPRQPQPGAGERENGQVRLISEVNDGFNYPPVAKVIRVTVTPVP